MQKSDVDGFFDFFGVFDRLFQSDGTIPTTNYDMERYAVFTDVESTCTTSTLSLAREREYVVGVSIYYYFENLGTCRGSTSDDVNYFS